MSGMPKGTKIHIWTEEEKEYLREITTGKSHKEILELMNNKFEYQFRLSQIRSGIKTNKLNTGLTGRFKKGTTPWNKGTKGICKIQKTSFQKGHTPANHRKIGSERVNSDGYTEIKVAEPNVWKLKQRVVWEKHHGEIEKGYSVIFADRDKSNFNIENLRLVNRKQLLEINRHNFIKTDANLTDVGINVANVLIKMHELERKL